MNMHRTTHEKSLAVMSGWPMLALNLTVLFGSAAVFCYATAHDRVGGVIAATVAHLLGWVLTMGHFTLQPNEACVLVLFGDYRGTVRESGFHWTNPFYAKPKVSLRSRNFDGGKLKVNDLRGNPIEISAVVVWRVADTAKALFDVEDYAHFVKVQSESALRQLASRYPYDHGSDDDGDHNETTLRSDADEVATGLRQELQHRLEQAGVEIEDARLNHLAYAPEIAGAMLRRQQAEAIIAARRKIVHGAVSMVEMALTGLADQKVVELDEERKAAMVSNLLVVLCGETEAHPVINTGTLYG
ncbi:MAG: SPFH domain-containing protein [Planctomycetota bacterium]